MQSRPAVTALRWGGNEQLDSTRAVICAIGNAGGMILPPQADGGQRNSQSYQCYREMEAPVRELSRRHRIHGKSRRDTGSYGPTRKNRGLSG